MAVSHDRANRIEVAFLETIKGHSGRVALKAILEALPTEAHDFTADPYAHAYAAGRRAAGVEVRDMIRALGVSYLRLVEDEEI